ncbi:MAG: phosphatidylglycerol lysyltransferase domain-containing protein, partial [Candidatus Eremiobacterota bacterium]
KGKAGKDLRPPLNKLTKLGYRAELHKPPLTDKLIGELKSISDEWLTMMHGTEKKFTLGWFDYEYIKNCPVMAVHGPEGDITAFANIIPIYSCNQSTIDLMRRKKKIENGTMDFLFISLLEWARENGNTGFSLGLCPFTGIEDESNDPVIEKALKYIYENINQFFNFKGIHTFKEKFQPEWSPRYIIYPSQALLPSVCLSLVQAIEGKNFIRDHLKDLYKKSEG